MITDLLKTENTNLKIHETVERGIFVGNLSEEFVSNEDQVLQLMKSGEGINHPPSKAFQPSSLTRVPLLLCRKAKDRTNKHE